ncbi:ATP-dependent helicase wrn-1-like [Montipora capricornis]|uniref:ATP-dependent helicase wrn-1-like n=1 Tax=Montipora capricornis TaxID=246305 RepID=UPI0035F1BF6A
MEEQITSNEFSLSAAELRFYGETLNSIRNGEVQVVYATPEQALKEQFTALLKEDCPFRHSLSLIVVDESHTVYTCGKYIFIFTVICSDLTNFTLRGFDSQMESAMGIPVLALTGRVDIKLRRKIRHMLSLRPDVHCITLSPERSNIKFTVMKVKREQYHCNFEWIADMIKTQGLATPKTIIFCNTMTNVASVVGNLFAMLGNAVYVPGRPQVPENKVVGIFHSLTLPKYKKRLMDSFKSDSGCVRVVIATSALSMGVNFPDTKYVVHYGPARSLVDHIQEVGGAGRNGEKADDITIYYGQQLAACEKGVKDFMKTDGCLRKAIFVPFKPDVESVTPMHECCSMCEQDCKCSGDRCSRIPQPFDHEDSVNSTTYTSLFERNVYPEDKEALRSALIGLKERFDSTGSPAFDPVSTHGFSIELIEAIVSDCAHCATQDYLMASFPLFSEEHAFVVLEILHEIFDDIPGIEELMQITVSTSSTSSHVQVTRLCDIEDYFEEPNSLCFEDDDRVNVEELENP